MGRLFYVSDVVFQRGDRVLIPGFGSIHNFDRETSEGLEFSKQGQPELSPKAYSRLITGSTVRFKFMWQHRGERERASLICGIILQIPCCYHRKAYVRSLAWFPELR